MPRDLLRAAATVPAFARALPLAAHRLRSAGRLDDADRDERSLGLVTLDWAAARVASVARDLAVVGAVAREAGTRAFLCKGAALHGLVYADPAARPMADVDLFVPEDDVPAFHRALLARGFVPAADAGDRVLAYAASRGDPWLLDLGYRSPEAGTVVEVKADPIGVGLPIRRLDVLSEGGEPSPCYAGFLLPSAEAMALQSAFSLSRRETFDLLAYAEMAAFLRARRAALDPGRALGLLEGEGLFGILRSVLGLTERLFPGSVPRPLLDRRAGPPESCGRGRDPPGGTGGSLPRSGPRKVWGVDGRWRSRDGRGGGPSPRSRSGAASRWTELRRRGPSVRCAASCPEPGPGRPPGPGV
jgi:hypothetical protein